MGTTRPRHDPMPKRCPHCESVWEYPDGERYPHHGPLCHFDYHVTRVTNTLIPAGLRHPDNLAFREALQDLIAWAIERAIQGGGHDHD